MLKLSLSFFLLGFSFGFGPCLASCGPLLITYIAGTGKHPAKSALAYLLFSFSRILVYLVLSAAVFLLGQTVTQYTLGHFSRYLFLVGGLFIILLGILIIFGKNPGDKFCQKLGNFLLGKDKKTVVTLGIITGILPCAPLISALSYIGLISKNWPESLFYGFSFGLGTIASPLFILAVFAGFIPGALLKKNKIYRIFNFICGLIIIFLGAQLLRRAF